MTDIDPRFVARFNQAAASARTGAHDDALAAYRALVDDIARGEGRATEEFVTVARMRAAFCLMDLGRHADAVAELASLPLSSLDDDARYEAHFARGNALGRVGRYEDAFFAFVEAISCAEDIDIEDEVRPLACWAAVFEHALRAGDLDFAVEKAAIALNAARLRGFTILATLAEATLVEQSALADRRS